MTDTGVVPVAPSPPAPAPTAKKKRGRENALDMVRSLAVVFLVVIPLWFFGQSSPGDSKSFRPIDPTPALHDFATDSGGPVPHTPSGWRVNVQAYDAGVVRVGYVVGEHYAEFFGGVGPGFLGDATGKGKQVSTVQINGATWAIYESADAHESLVRSVGKATVLVGGIRETATQDELQALAATIR
jgi:hypothetical protein